MSVAQDSLSAQAMHQDIDYYFKTIRECHPKLYVRYAPEVFDSLQASLKAQCSATKKKSDFWFLLAKTSKYTDGHTRIFSPFDDIPVDMYFPWVDFDEKGQLLLDSSLIVSINGVPASQIANDLEELVSWEHSPVGRTRHKNTILSLLYPFHPIVPPFQLTLFINNTYKDTVVGIHDQETLYSKYHPSFNKRYHSSLFTSDIFKEDSIAVLYYNTSDILGIFNKEKDFNTNEGMYKQYIESFFKNIREQGIRFLFIDVSQNGGGSDLVHQLYFKYLISKSYRYQSTVHINRTGLKRCYQFIHQLLKEDKEKKSWVEIKKKFNALERRNGKVKKNSEKGNKSGFEGQVFSIMDENTYSAGYDFCEYFKRSGAGPLVGEASGQRSPFAGNIFLDQLPNSKIEFSCATTYAVTEPKITDSDGFLQPDIPYTMDHPLGLEDYKKIIQLSKEKKGH